MSLAGDVVLEPDEAPRRGERRAQGLHRKPEHEVLRLRVGEGRRADVDPECARHLGHLVRVRVRVRVRVIGLGLGLG